MHFLNFILVKNYMFRTDLLSTISSLNTVYTAIGICHTSYVDCLLADGNITSMTNTYCCEYSIKTHNDAPSICPKYVEFSTKIKLRNSAFVSLYYKGRIFMYSSQSL